jgi:hypothetical protein
LCCAEKASFGDEPWTYYYGVKFYVPDPKILKDDHSRYVCRYDAACGLSGELSSAGCLQKLCRLSAVLDACRLSAVLDACRNCAGSRQCSMLAETVQALGSAGCLQKLCRLSAVLDACRNCAKADKEKQFT